MMKKIEVNMAWKWNALLLGSSRQRYWQGKFYLIAESKANEAGIHGAKIFATGDKKYWSCGNKSTYISINISLILLVLMSL